MDENEKIRFKQILSTQFKDNITDLKWNTISSNEDYMEPMSSHINKKYKLQPISAKYIILQNINRKTIPVNKIIIIDNTRQIYKISIDEASIKNMGSGISITFTLPRELIVTQIILDINIFCASQKNMRTTQLTLKDKKYNTTFENETPFDVGKRYIYIHMIKPKIIYGGSEPEDGLCRGKPGVSDSDQELILNESLLHNTWSI